MVGSANRGRVLLIRKIRVAVDQVVVTVDIFVGSIAKKLRALAKLPFPAVFGVVVDKSSIEVQFFGGLIVSIQGNSVNVGIIFGCVAVRPKLGR